MTLSNVLEDFGMGPANSVGARQASAAEDDLLDSFEDGYKAGWDDAIKAKAEEQTSISADFARNILDLSFTYHEAHTAMIADMAPVLEQIIGKILPHVAQQSIGLHILDELDKIIAKHPPQNILVTVSPTSFETMSSLVPQDLTFPLEVRKDDTLADGQAHLKFDNQERQIDIGDVLDGISKAFAGFAHETKREAANA